LPEEFKTDAYRVEGCLAQLWLVPERKGALCVFRVDSDSAIMKGIAVLLCDFYSGLTPTEVLEAEPAFLLQAGITQHLAVNRRNGLSRVVENIRQFARDRIEPPAAKVSALPHERGGEA
jgi:cysteine desulfuration protein SufE